MDRKELKDEELDLVNGGMMKPSTNKGLPDMAGIGGGQTRTTGASSCSSFKRNPDANATMICANCIYFHKEGDSGVCNNLNKGPKTAVI